MTTYTRNFDDAQEVGTIVYCADASGAVAAHVIVSGVKVYDKFRFLPGTTQGYFLGFTAQVRPA